MKILGKIWKFLVLLIIILLVAMVLIPYIYQDDLKQALKEEINNNINAKADFKDISLSLFKSFPQLALSIEDLSISGIDEFKNIDLLKSETITLNADLSTVFDSNTPIKINSVKIDGADVNIIVDKNGKANYEIYESAEGGESTEFVIELEEYEINNSNFLYHDLAGNTKMTLVNVNHVGQGNFTSELFDLNTTTMADKFSMESGGVPYLNKVRLSGDNKISINNSTSTYTLDKNKVKLNQLDLNVDGKVRVRDKIDVNMDFDAPNATFGEFMSLLPTEHKGQIADLNSKGMVDLKGSVKGTYDSDKNQLPGYKLDMNIRDGYIQYPDAPQPVENVNMEVHVASANVNEVSVDVPKFSFKSGKNFADGNMVYSSNKDNPKIATNVNAVLDLEDLSQSFPLEGVDKIQGIVNVNELKIDTDFASIENKNYDKILFEGKVNVEDVDILMEDTPEIKLNKLDLVANPKEIAIDNARLNLGNTDLSIDGKLENPLAYFVAEQNIEGSLDVKSKSIDLNEWLAEESAGSSGSTLALSQNLETLARESGVDITLKADEILYTDYVLVDNDFKGSITGEDIKIEKYATSIYDNDIEVEGHLEGLYDYVINNDKITGVLSMSSDAFDVNPFLAATGDTTQVSEAYRVPENMDIEIQTSLKDVSYQKMNFDRMNGTIAMKDGAILFNEVVSQALGGDMNFEGTYDSTVEEPLFSLKYDMSKVRFAETFASFTTVQKLAGILGYIDGVFNSTLVMEANLNNKMFPNLSTLNANGFIETITGKLKEIGPLNEISKQLGVNELNKVDLSNTKNWFEVKNGTVGLKPETYNISGMEMIVSGNHAYNSDMSYTILAKIPRSKLEGNAVTNSVKDGWEYLEEKAGKIGLDIGQGEFINVRIDLGGSLLKPLIDITPIGSEGRSLKQQVKDEITQKVNDTRDTIIQVANEKVEQVKDSVTTVVENAIDTVSSKVESEINKQVDTLQSKAKEKIEEKVDTLVHDILGETLDTLINDNVDTLLQGTIKDILGDKKEAEVDKIKDKIKDWNPFKKKGG